MTEMTVIPKAVDRFILAWGEMGGFWGVNRSVAQIHAFLYMSPEPMTAEDISVGLAMARSNVSNSLKELLRWGLVRRVLVKGDRREYFEAEADVWEMATRIAAGRKEREVDPALAALRKCVEEGEGDPDMHPEALARLRRMLEFTETISRWYEQMTRVPRPKVLALLRLGSKIASLLPDRNK